MSTITTPSPGARVPAREEAPSASRTTQASIPAYALPTPAEFPVNVAPWRPDPTRSLLLVHDMQRYFLDFYPDGPMREQLVGRVSTLIVTARAAGVPVAYTAQPGSMTAVERGLIADFWGDGMRSTEADRAVVEACAPRPGDIVETKWRYSAFLGNDLGARIAASGRDQVAVCGVFTSIGCLMSACEAFSRDLETFFVGDATADFARSDHDIALDYAARRCAVVIGHHALAEAWTPPSPDPFTRRSRTPR